MQNDRKKFQFAFIDKKSVLIINKLTGQNVISEEVIDMEYSIDIDCFVAKRRIRWYCSTSEHFIDQLNLIR